MFWYVTRWFRMSKWQLIGATAFWVVVAVCLLTIPDHTIALVCGGPFLVPAAIFGSILVYKVRRDRRLKQQTAAGYQQPPQVMGPPRMSDASQNFMVPPRHPDDRS